MRVAVEPVDDMGVGNYRLRFPAAVLAAEGHDVVIDTAGPPVIWDREWHTDSPPTDGRVLGLGGIPDADIIVFQRPTVLYRLDAIRHLQDAGVKVVVDIDDRLDRVDRRHAAKKGFHQAMANHQILDYCCAEADLVTCSTPALARRYGHGHGVVLPNYVPAAYLSVWGLKRPETVGWSGYVGSHPGDLQVTGGAVDKVLSENWSFHVVGPPDGVAKALGLRDEPSSTGTVPFVDYPAMLAELEVGIVPLEASEFNDAKSCLKLMEMAALGVPCVGSPTPDNLRLHRAGVGLIAESRGQWRRLLTKLTTDTAYRYDMADAGRQAMAGFTYEEHAGRWLEAWASLLDAKVSV